MIQEIREKIFTFRVGQFIQIDNMNFKIKNMYVEFEDNSSYSISIWGDKPHATTISKNRIVRLEDLLWMPRKIDVFTEKKSIFTTFCRDKQLQKFLELQKAEKDKVTSISVEMDTMLNPYIHYGFE